MRTSCIPRPRLYRPSQWPYKDTMLPTSVLLEVHVRHFGFEPRTSLGVHSRGNFGSVLYERVLEGYLDDARRWRFLRMNPLEACQTFASSTVKIVDTPIVMSASPNSVKSRRKTLSECAENASESNSLSKQEPQPQAREPDSLIRTDEMKRDDVAERSSTPSIDSSARRPPSGRISWAVRMIQFLRGLRWRPTKAKNPIKRSECENQVPDSPKVTRRTPKSAGELTGTPSCPSLTVLAVDDEPPSQSAVEEEAKEQRPPSRWSLHVEEALKVESRRKLSACEYDIQKSEKLALVNRKLTVCSSMAPGSSLWASLVATRLTEYVVNVKTSDRFGAGTDANVSLQLFGDLGSSEVLALTHSNNVNKFERNQLDRFVIRDLPSVGRVQSIRIWHDNSGVGAPWHLAYVEVSDTNLGLLFRFPCHSWLSETGDALGISRELRCFEVLEGPKKAVQTASGVAKTESMSALNVRSSRAASLPVSPVMMRKTSRTPPKALVLSEPKVERYREVPAESVFTPALTRPSPVVRLPVGDDDDSSESDFGVRLSSPLYQHASTVPVFSTSTLARAAERKISLDGRSLSYDPRGVTNGRKRTVYGLTSAPASSRNGRLLEGSLRVAVEVVRRASLSSSTSSIVTEPEQVENRKLVYSVET